MVAWLQLKCRTRWWCKPRGGDTAFTPAGVRFLDRVRALFMPMRPHLTPGFIRTLREALHLTQHQFGEAVGVDKMTVFRWEKGILRPSEESVKAIKRLRDKAVRRGVEITLS
jgi:DNA-binding XRE family transcriptional regulator